MLKVGVIIDVWKLTIFDRRLVEAKYTFEQHPGPMKGTILLQVHTNSVEQLGNVIKAAQIEAAERKTK